MTEYRKLKDWNPKKGDVFQSKRSESNLVCVSDGKAKFTWSSCPLPINKFKNMYELISRADPELQIFVELSSHQKKELVGAWIDGKTIEWYSYTGWKEIQNPCWADSVAYRIKPEPVITHIKQTHLVYDAIYNTSCEVEYTLTDGKVTDVRLISSDKEEDNE